MGLWLPHDSAIKMQAFIAFAARKFESYENNPYLCSWILSIGYMEPKIGDRMKVSPQLTDQADWIEKTCSCIKKEFDLYG